MLGGIAVLVLVWDGLITCSVFNGQLSLGVCCGRRLRLGSSWLRTPAFKLYHNLGILSQYGAV